MEGKNLCRASDVNSPLKKLPTRFCSYLFKNRKKKSHAHDWHLLGVHVKAHDGCFLTSFTLCLAVCFGKTCLIWSAVQRGRTRSWEHGNGAVTSHFVSSTGLTRWMLRKLENAMSMIRRHIKLWYNLRAGQSKHLWKSSYLYHVNDKQTYQTSTFVLRYNEIRDTVK